jgi:hypothetical protein
VSGKLKKLTEEQLADLLESYRAGETIESIARRLGNISTAGVHSHLRIRNELRSQKNGTARLHDNESRAAAAARARRNRQGWTPERRERDNARRRTPEYLHQKRAERYELSETELKELQEKSQGICEICNRFIGESKLHVDHCHDSNKVRGLICGPCNRGIGLFDENMATLFRAIQYLARRR